VDAVTGDDPYVNIREFIGWTIGRKIVDVTQQDRDEFIEDGDAYVMLLLDNGGYVKFLVETGFYYSEDGANEEQVTADEE
jgi:hypothetical protein